MEQRISLITLGVHDLKKMRDFYRALGWSEAAASNVNIAFIQAGGVVLALYPRNELAADIRIPATGSGFAGFALAHNVREKQQVAAVLAEAVAAGGKLIKPAQDVFWGGHSGYFADPEGNYWEVAWNPFFAFDERGQLNI